jgi:hypothetical protein
MLPPYKWFYLWSPKYEIFHTILQSCIQDTSGIDLHPIFLPQSVFEPKLALKKDEHWFRGNAIKYRLLVSILTKHPGEYIVFSDADLLVFDEDKTLSDYLKQYEENDITFMRENPDSMYLNIGCMLIKSSPYTVSFFNSLIALTETSGEVDQTVLNREIQRFEGKTGCFSIPDVVQSNSVNVNTDTCHRIIQCLNSNGDYETILFEKLITVCLFLDITPFKHVLPETVVKMLILHGTLNDSSSYLGTWTMPSSSE